MTKTWLTDLDDGIRINQLAIPGTHDAGAWTHHCDIPSSTPGTWAQRKNITEQLDLGVRVLDLRVGYKWGITGTYIGMFHGPIFLDSSLEDVLKAVKTWLTANPKEFVIFIFQQQGKPPQDDAAADILALVKDKIGRDSFHAFDHTRRRWPTIGELRGKVMCFGRLKSKVDEFCDVRSWLGDGDNTPGRVIDAAQNLKIYLQDQYKNISGSGGYVSRGDDNTKKFNIVKAAAQATPDVTASLLLRINHMSYSNLRYQPWESGEGVNTKLRASSFRIEGVLMIDDADQDTVDHILANNSRL